MKTFFKLSMIVFVALFCVFSCTKPPEVLSDVNYDLIVNYPSSASPGSPTTVSLSFLGKPNFPATIRWYADQFAFPQSLKKHDVVNSEEEVDYIFTFPYLSEGDYYYIRCSVTMPETNNTSRQSVNTMEKTVRILSMK